MRTAFARRGLMHVTTAVVRLTGETTNRASQQADKQDDGEG
ncbi:hypothetical protein RE6C_02789 [Rhodopirellula europaea 6C]|uniref:Uncharacterized protein n=1 Tax=Rhodopirellula europaea 6C TaxID=1263867 RepID=M2B2J2_9BACT|nr:hypothetical protein RE6C_02789 [Rhodopirellula europaea 6C]